MRASDFGLFRLLCHLDLGLAQTALLVAVERSGGSSEKSGAGVARSALVLLQSASGIRLPIDMDGNPQQDASHFLEGRFGPTSESPTIRSEPSPGLKQR